MYRLHCKIQMFYEICESAADYHRNIQHLYEKKGEILKDTVVIIAFVQSVAHLRQVSVTVN